MTALVLCCAMLTGTAMAAGPLDSPRVVKLNDVTVVFGAERPDVMPLSVNAEETFVNEVMTRTSAYSISRTCNAANGNYLGLTVENRGTTDLKITVSITMNGQTVRDSQIVKARTAGQATWPSYFTSAVDQNGAGLTCSFTYTVEPNIRGQEITFWAFCQQRNQ